MARLIVHVEGETEETFVNEILAPHLYEVGYHAVGARLLGNARLRDRRGGARPWPSVQKDIVRRLREDEGCLATTMVDYYGLPAGGYGAWPGRAEAAGRPFARRAEVVEGAIREAIRASVGHERAANRFLPFVVMHEFEGLLFSDCDRFAAGIGRPNLAPRFAGIRSAFGSPEEINDSPNGAPSHRVRTLVKDYQKPLHGNLAALEIGLELMRSACPHFDSWLRVLESLPATR